MTEAQRRRFRRLVAGLNSLLDEVRRDHPDAQWYLDGTCGLCLMSGDPFGGGPAGRGGNPHPDRILERIYLPRSSGGDW